MTERTTRLLNNLHIPAPALPGADVFLPPGESRKYSDSEQILGRNPISHWTQS